MVMLRMYRLSSLIVVATVALALPPSIATADGYNRPTGYYRTVRWESSASSAKGLMFFRSTSQGLVRRVLVETPQGRHLTLTKALLVRRGVDREVLRDEETGWAAELTKRSDYRTSSLSEYFAGVFEWMVPGQGREIEMVLRTSTGLSFSASVPVQAQPAQEHARFAALLERDIAGESDIELPEGLGDALAFLDAAFEPAGSDARGIIDILSAAVDISEGGAGAVWRQVNGEDLHRPELIGADEKAFASDFPSVDAVTPLPVETLDAFAEEERKGQSESR